MHSTVLPCVQYNVKFRFRAGLLKSLMLLTPMASLLPLLSWRRPLFSNSSHTKDCWNTFKVIRARKLRHVLVEQVCVPAQKAKWIAALDITLGLLGNVVCHVDLPQSQCAVPLQPCHCRPLHAGQLAAEDVVRRWSMLLHVHSMLLHCLLQSA